MENNISQVLTSLGMNEKESALYLALLQLGTAPASVLGNRTGITRSTTQYACNQLVKKGLFRTIQRQNTFLYTAEPPEKLLILLEQQREDLERKEQRLQNVMGDLKSLRNPDSVLPKVQFYEGLSGVYSMIDDIVNSTPKETKIFSFIKALQKTNIPSEFKENYTPQLQKIIEYFQEKRLEKKITNYVLATDSPEAKELKKTDKKYLRETKIIPHFDLKFIGGELFLCPEKMYSIIVEENNLMGYSVRNKALIQMHKALFQIAWKNTPQPKK